MRGKCRAGYTSDMMRVVRAAWRAPRMRAEAACAARGKTCAAGEGAGDAGDAALRRRRHSLSSSLAVVRCRTVSDEDGG